MIRSLRNRLLFGYLLGMALLMAVSGWSIHRLVESTETYEFDDNLFQFTQRIAVIAEQEQGQVTFEWDQLGSNFDMDIDPEEAEDGGGYLFTIQGGPSGVIASNVEALPGVPHLEPSWSVEPRFRGYHLPDGSHVREVSYQFPVRLDNNEPAGTKARTLAITAIRRTTEIDAMLGHMRLILLSVGVPIVLVSGLGVYLLLRRSLRDLKPLRSQLENLAEGDLAQNILPGSLPSEFLPLIKSINELTHGLNQRISREKYFVATAAHELRTPVATVMSNLQLALGNDADPEADHPVARAYKVSLYMKQVVQRLLQLTRMENTHEPSEQIAIDPAEFISDTIELYGDRLRIRDVKIECDLPEVPVGLVADPVLLANVVGNLIANMVSYTLGHKTATIQLSRENNVLRFVFRNPTSPDNVADVSRVTEPFWRADATRNLKDQHAGLGLAIAQAAAHKMGAALSFAAADGHYFTATLVVPGLGLDGSTAPPVALPEPTEMVG